MARTIFVFNGTRLTNITASFEAGRGENKWLFIYADTTPERPDNAAFGDICFTLDSLTIWCFGDDGWTAIGNSGPGGAVTWASIIGKPTTFPPVIGPGATDAVAGNDPRLTDDRNPLPHATDHENGGGDEISVAGLSGVLADPQTAVAHAATHVTGGGDTIADVVAAGNAGLMSGTDKTKLDGIATGAEVNVNADWTSGSGDSQILNKPATFAPAAHATSHVTGGTDVIANAVASGDAGLLSGSDKAKLDGIAAGAEVNVNADWTAVGGDALILNKPSTFAPTLHATNHQNGGTDEINVVGLSGVLADPQPPIIGSGAAQAVAGNDARLTDARTPTVHDIISLHNGFPGGTTNFLRADGSFAAPTAVAGDPDMPSSGSFTVATAKYHLVPKRAGITGSQRITIAGTGRLRMAN